MAQGSKGKKKGKKRGTIEQQALNVEEAELDRGKAETPCIKKKYVPSFGKPNKISQDTVEGKRQVSEPSIKESMQEDSTCEEKITDVEKINKQQVEILHKEVTEEKDLQPEPAAMTSNVQNNYIQNILTGQVQASSSDIRVSHDGKESVDTNTTCMIEVERCDALKKLNERNNIPIAPENDYLRCIEDPCDDIEMKPAEEPEKLLGEAKESVPTVSDKICDGKSSTVPTQQNDPSNTVFHENQKSLANIHDSLKKTANTDNTPEIPDVMIRARNSTDVEEVHEPGIRPEDTKVTNDVTSSAGDAEKNMPSALPMHSDNEKSNINQANEEVATDVSLDVLLDKNRSIDMTCEVSKRPVNSAIGCEATSHIKTNLYKEEIEGMTKSFEVSNSATSPHNDSKDLDTKENIVDSLQNVPLHIEQNKSAVSRCSENVIENKKTLNNARDQSLCNASKEDPTMSKQPVDFCNLPSITPNILNNFAQKSSKTQDDLVAGDIQRVDMISRASIDKLSETQNYSLENGHDPKDAEMTSSQIFMLDDEMPTSPTRKSLSENVIEGEQEPMHKDLEAYAVEGSAIMKGLIDELSSVTKMIVGMKRHMDSIKKQQQTKINTMWK